jgi:hypothetical protein
MMPGLSLDDHRSTAADLHASRNRLMKLIELMPQSGREYRTAVVALRKIDLLRTLLDDAVCGMPGVEKPERIYYEPGAGR